MNRLFLAGLAGLLFTTALGAQGFGGNSSVEPKALTPELAAAKQRDAEAAEGFTALKLKLEKIIKPTTEGGSEAAQMEAFQKILGLLEEFAGNWSGTDSEVIAWLNVGMVNINLLDRPDPGFIALRTAWNKAKARPVELLASSVVTPAIVGLQLGEALMKAGRYDQAKPVFEELANYDGPESERAGFQLDQIKVLAAVSVGRTVPSFSGKDLDGEEVTPEQYRGKVVLIDFWAIWCGPCRAEMPNVVAVYEEFREKGFDVIGVSLDQADKADQVRKFALQNKMGWRQIYDGGYWEAAVAKQFGVNSIPATFLLDRNGVIRFRGLRGSAMRDAIKKLLAEGA